MKRLRVENKVSKTNDYYIFNDQMNIIGIESVFSKPVPLSEFLNFSRILKRVSTGVTSQSISRPPSDLLLPSRDP